MKLKLFINQDNLERVAQKSGWPLEMVIQRYNDCVYSDIVPFIIIEESDDGGDNHD